MNNQHTNQRTRLIIALGLIALGVGSRWLFYTTSFVPNIELVTVCALLAGYYLRGWYPLVVPLATLFLSDTLIGNSSIFLFTWSAFLLAGAAGYLLRRRTHAAHPLAPATLTGIGFALFFFLWTNFGVWAQGWYPPTGAGLLESYAMGLPFLKLHLVSTLVFVPVGFVVAEFIRMRSAVAVRRSVSTENKS